MPFPAKPIKELELERGLVGGPFGSSLGSRDYVDEGVPVIRGTNLGFGREVSGEFVFVDDSKASGDLARNLAVPGDLVFTQRGTLGQVARVPSGPFDRYVVSQSQMRLRVDPRIANPDYVYYACTSGQFNLQIHDNAIATGVPHINLGILGRLTIPVPSVDEQRAIAEVLGALDDKIAANRKLEATTRKLAAALFSFASHGGVASSVDELAEFHNRRRVPLSASQRELMQGDVPYYGATGQFGTVDRAIFDEILVLVGEDGSVINDDESPVTQYVWGPAWVNNHAHVLTGRTCSSEVLLLALQQANVTPLVTGAVQAKISMGNLKKLTLTVPNESSISELEPKIQPMFALLRKLADETLSLTILRDTLLPRLMSGELRVRDAVRQVEGVL